MSARDAKNRTFYGALGHTPHERSSTPYTFTVDSFPQVLELFRSAMKSKIEGYMYEQGDSSSSSSSSDSDDDDDEDDQKQGTALQQTKLDHMPEHAARALVRRFKSS
jgi:hypothetical protein